MPNHATMEVVEGAPEGNVLGTDANDQSEINDSAEDYKRRLAVELNARINSALDKMSQNLTIAYIDIGKTLNDLRKDYRYRLLGHSKFDTYLDTIEPRFKKTYCYYVMRLGKAGDLIAGRI